jgi:TonB-linked SusC/RagA family outer membrane protein
MGVGYNGEEGIYKGDKSNRINFKGSLDAKINKILSAGFSVNGARIKNEYANDAAVQSAYRMNPYMIPYDAEGNLNAKPGNSTALHTSSYQFSDEPNPLLKMKSSYEQRETWRVLGNFYLKFDIIKGLDFKTTFSPSYTYYRNGYFEGYKDENGNYYDSGLSANAAELTNHRGFSWTWDNIINYNTTIANDHSIGAMLLFSQQASNTEKTYWAATEVMENTDWWNMGTGTYNADDSYTSYTENSMTSYALRLNYSYKSRYLLTATVRRDGSSKFTKDNRWGTFPSVALAWRLSEESFMQKFNWLSNLKLRLSYGVTGNNDGIGNYATQQTVSSPIYYPFGSTYKTGYTASSIVNKDLKWETSTEYNAGIDFGFFGGRINGSIDVYQKTSKDLLYTVALPLESGGGTMTTNIGSVRNTGIEIALTTINVENKDWHWETTFTFAANKNKVREINGTGDKVLSSGITTGSLFIGSSVNNTYAYEWGGVVSDRDMIVPDNQAARNAGLKPGSTIKEYDYFFKAYGLTEGQPWVIDQNGDGTLNEDDRVIKSMDPNWTGSFTSNLTWKNWDFSFSLYAKVGYKVYSSFLTSNILELGDRGRQKLNMDWYIPAGTLIDCDGVNEDGTYINPKYQETTHYGEYPFPNNGGSSSGVGRQSSEWNIAKGISTASFMKVKNITLGYTFDKNFLNKFGCKHLRLYATVTNPFVFTSYKGFDPEWASAGVKQDGPSTINYQVGASIKF